LLLFQWFQFRRCFRDLIDLWLLIFVFVNMHQINYMIVVVSVISTSFLFILILYWTWPIFVSWCILRIKLVLLFLMIKLVLFNKILELAAIKCGDIDIWKMRSTNLVFKECVQCVLFSIICSWCFSVFPSFTVL
jgi:hypothetical protein